MLSVLRYNINFKTFKTFIRISQKLFFISPYYILPSLKSGGGACLPHTKVGEGDQTIPFLYINVDADGVTIYNILVVLKSIFGIFTYKIIQIIILSIAKINNSPKQFLAVFDFIFFMWSLKHIHLTLFLFDCSAYDLCSIADFFLSKLWTIAICGEVHFTENILMLSSIKFLKSIQVIQFFTEPNRQIFL